MELRLLLYTMTAWPTATGAFYELFFPKTSYPAESTLTQDIEINLLFFDCYHNARAL